jgi:predicted metal-dependent RNase
MISKQQYINLHKLLKITILRFLLSRQIHSEESSPYEQKLNRQQPSHFIYMGFNVTYDTNKDIKMQLSKFRHICGTFKRTLKYETTEQTQISFIRQ